MGKFSRLIKYIFKSALHHNPFDAFVGWHRKRLEKKGKTYDFDWNVYWTVGYLFFPRILRITNKFTFEGAEHLPKEGPFIVICNHNDTLDPFYAGVALSCGPFLNRDKPGQVARHVSWVSKLANLKTPLMKSIICYFNTIPLGEGRHMAEKTWEKIEETIEKGEGIGFFPEGGRGRTKEERSMIREFHTGAARLCVKYDMPYVPMVLKGKRSFFKGKASAVIGRPVYLKKSLDASYDMLKNVANEMQKQMDALFKGKKTIPISKYEQAPARVQEKLDKSLYISGPSPSKLARERPAKVSTLYASGSTSKFISSAKKSPLDDAKVIEKDNISIEPVDPSEMIDSTE